MQLRSHLGLRVTPSKVKPFQFDHKQGEVVNAEEKSCETSKGKLIKFNSFCFSQSSRNWIREPVKGTVNLFLLCTPLNFLELLTYCTSVILKMCFCSC